MFVFLCGCVEGANPTVFYSFEPPNFDGSDHVPLLDKSPNVGDVGFSASFTSTSGAGDFVIDENPNLPEGLSLFDVNLFSPSTLTVTLNTQVSAVEFDFALFDFGHLDFSSPSGTTSAENTASSQAGQLSFSSVQPFTQFSLVAFGETGSQTLFGIDNLEMTPAPHPRTHHLHPARPRLTGVGGDAAAGLFCLSRDDTSGRIG